MAPTTDSGRVRSGGNVFSSVARSSSVQSSTSVEEQGLRSAFRNVQEPRRVSYLGRSSVCFVFGMGTWAQGKPRAGSGMSLTARKPSCGRFAAGVRYRSFRLVWTIRMCTQHVVKRQLGAWPVMQSLQRWRPDPILSLAMLGLLVLNVAFWVWNKFVLTRRMSGSSGSDPESHWVPLGQGTQTTGVWQAFRTDETIPSVEGKEQLDGKFPVSDPERNTVVTAGMTESVGFGETLRQLGKRLRELENLAAEKEAQRLALEHRLRELEQAYFLEKSRRQDCQKQLSELKQIAKQQQIRWGEQEATIQSETDAQVQRIKAQARKQSAALKLQLKQVSEQAKQWQTQAQARSAQIEKLQLDLENVSQRERELRGQDAELAQRYRALLRSWKALRADHEQTKALLDARMLELESERQERKRLQRQNTQLRQQIQAWTLHYQTQDYRTDEITDTGMASELTREAPIPPQIELDEASTTESEPKLEAETTTSLGGTVSSRKRRIQVDNVDHVLEVGFFRQEFGRAASEKAVHTPPDLNHKQDVEAMSEAQGRSTAAATAQGTDSGHSSTTAGSAGSPTSGLSVTGKSGALAQPSGSEETTECDSHSSGR
jgi:hypothetical protein